MSNENSPDEVMEATENFDEYTPSVKAELEGILGVAWDECHKIYLVSCAKEAQWFRESEYLFVENRSKEEYFELVKKFYIDSCWLRFVNKILPPPGPLEEEIYLRVIPQI